MKSRFFAVALGRAALELTPATETDPLRMDAIVQALDATLKAAKARRANLKERMEDVLAWRPAMTQMNSSIATMATNGDCGASRWS
ncbi:hypothetical protein Q2941_19360 [Bradyrhizobium sp. UFLA05-153]